MEQETIKTEGTKKGSYITGIIGAVIGGFIATIPWVLAYVYGGMMLSILAALIAAGEFYGYKITKGKMNKKLPIILMVIAIIIVTITTLVIIPALLIQKEGITVSFGNIERLYQNSEFATAIMKDFAISVIFTILGASIITTNIKKQLENNDGQDVKLDFSNKEQVNEIKKSAIELIKPIFIKYEAISQDKPILKDEVIAEIDDKRKAKYSFTYLKQLGIIKKYKGKYYYLEDAENETTVKKMGKAKKIFLIVILILFILLALIAMLQDMSQIVEYQDSNVKFEIQKGWSRGQSQYQTEWNFYKYINNVPKLNANNEIQENDYSSYPAGINVYYSSAEEQSINSIEDIKTIIEEKINNSEDKAEGVKIETSKTYNNYDLLKVRVEYKEDTDELLMYYYILNDGELACITGYSFNLDDETTIENDVTDLVNSFEWIK